MAILLDGKAMAASLMEEMKQRVQLLAGLNVTPGLAVILAGDDPASQTYVRNKGRASEELGIYSRTIVLPADVSQDELK